MSKHRLASIVTLSAVLLLTGCKVSFREGKPDIEWRILQSLLNQDDRDESEMARDRMWHEGYGFNNPNNERRRQGKPLLNFDGSEHNADGQ